MEKAGGKVHEGLRLTCSSTARGGVDGGQPGGGWEGSMEQLSGGQRSLASLAFLVAVRHPPPIPPHPAAARCDDRPYQGPREKGVDVFRAAATSVPCLHAYMVGAPGVGANQGAEAPCLRKRPPSPLPSGQLVSSACPCVARHVRRREPAAPGSACFCLTRWMPLWTSATSTLWRPCSRSGTGARVG